MDTDLVRQQALEYNRWADALAQLELARERVRELEELVEARETELKAALDKVEVLQTVVDGYEQSGALPGRDYAAPKS